MFSNNDGPVLVNGDIGERRTRNWLFTILYTLDYDGAFSDVKRSGRAAVSARQTRPIYTRHGRRLGTGESCYNLKRVGVPLRARDPSCVSRQQARCSRKAVAGNGKCGVMHFNAFSLWLFWRASPTWPSATIALHPVNIHSTLTEARVYDYLIGSRTLARTGSIALHRTSLTSGAAEYSPQHGLVSLQ